MRKELGKALRSLFSRAMKEKFHQFRETKVESVYFWPGERAFCLAGRKDLRCWIVLSPSLKDYDMFTVLVGWSRLGRYPELSMIPSIRLPDEAHGEFEEPEYLTRLPSLWTREDAWWVIREPLLEITIETLEKQSAPISPEEAQLLTAPHVCDALQKLGKYAVPYFEALQKFDSGTDGLEWF
ncbi:MAG: hypothetical protein AB2L14_33220 [Candidatus Xenobiia bacterium LiM19]